MYTPVAADVAKLRNTTGAGMMDCKKALVEAEGDFEKAIEILRKKGQKIAANRADRESTEGAVIARVNEDNTLGAIISLNCETDFVAKNDAFVELAYELAEQAMNYASKEEFLASDFHGITVAEKLIEQTGVIGEKIEIGAFERIEGPFLGAYIHAGNKIAAITALSAKVDGVAEAARNISMQVASMSPEVLSYKDFSPEFIAAETDARIAAIEKDNEELVRLGKPLKNVPKYVSYAQLTEQVLKQAEEDAKAELKAEGKPEQIWDKILPGKVQRFISDNTSLDQEKALLDQNYIKDGDMKVSQYVKSVNPNLEVVRFIRVSL